MSLLISRVQFFFLLRIKLPWWLSGQESACQCRRCRFALWVRKIPWRRNWQPTLVFLLGKPHGGAWWATQSVGSQRVGHNFVTKQVFHYMKTPQFIHLSADVHSYCFHFLLHINWLWTSMYTFWWTYTFPLYKNLVEWLNHMVGV